MFIVDRANLNPKSPQLKPFFFRVRVYYQTLFWVRRCGGANEFKCFFLMIFRSHLCMCRLLIFSYLSYLFLLCVLCFAYDRVPVTQGHRRPVKLSYVEPLPLKCVCDRQQKIFLITTNNNNFSYSNNNTSFWGNRRHDRNKENDKNFPFSLFSFLLSTSRKTHTAS